MPWAGLPREYSFGSARICPARQFIDDHVLEESLREQFENFVAGFVDSKGRPTNDCMVCYVDGKPLESPTEEESRLIKDAVNALSFACLIERTIEIILSGSASIVFPNSSDKFQLLHFDLIAGDVYSQIGDILDVSIPHEFKVTKPRHVIDWHPSKVTDLFEALDRYCQAKTPEERRKLFLSIETFNLALTNAESVSDSTRLVLMAVALEALLSNGGYDKKKMAKIVDSRCGMWLTKESWQVRNDLTVPITPAGKWFWSFYDSRSAVVHDKRLLASSDFVFQSDDKSVWTMQLSVAALILWQLVIHELNSADCLGSPIAYAIDPVIANSRCKTQADEKAQAAHIKLGWLSNPVHTESLHAHTR
jgi:hypothetical protein